MNRNNVLHKISARSCLPDINFHCLSIILSPSRGQEVGGGNVREERGDTFIHIQIKSDFHFFFFESLHWENVGYNSAPLEWQPLLHSEQNNPANYYVDWSDSFFSNDCWWWVLMVTSGDGQDQPLSAHCHVHISQCRECWNLGEFKCCFWNAIITNILSNPIWNFSNKIFLKS